MGGLSLDGGGHDGDPLSGSAGPVRPSLTRATPHRGSEMEKPFTGLRKEELQDFKLHSTSDSLGDVKNYD